MRVLVVGAGASIPADYPAGNDLLSRVERHFETSPVEENAKAYWKRFIDGRARARASASQETKLLWDNPNPEVVASFLDLCLEAFGSEDRDIDRYVTDVIHRLPPARNRDLRQTAIDAASKIVEGRHDNPARHPLNEARWARQGLLVGIYTLFRDFHWRDAEAHPNGPDYLQRCLSTLTRGDVVITTNYDSLIERVLLAASKWSPADGYAFSVPLSTVQSADAQVVRGGNVRSLPPEVQEPSQVMVLKLHGSVGWATQPQSFGSSVVGAQAYDGPKLYLSQDLFRGLVSESGPLKLPVFDSREPPISDPGDPAIVLPTYLKRTEGNEFHSIWRVASEALARADTVEIIGSSLPQSDVGIRVLMNPLRARLSAGRVSVTLQDPSAESLQRWKFLLGSGIKWEQRPLGR